MSYLPPPSGGCSTSAGASAWGLNAYFEFLKQFRVGPELKNITCPTLALVGEGEGDEAQAQEYVEGVSGPRQLYRFTVAQGADTHCQLNNLSYSNHVVLDWLDELFD